MFKATDVSVVIPSYNSQERLHACLESLAKQEEAPLEILVIDSSDDLRSQAVALSFPEVLVRRVKVRVFPGPARNKGARMAQGTIVAFLDADCMADPDWVRRIVAGHNDGHEVVGGAILVGNPSSQLAWAGHLGEFREFLPVGAPRPVLHIPTCNISYRKSIFDRFGGFPDAYYPQEDLLFNYLLTQNGIQIWFDPELRVRHFCRENLRDFLSHQHRIGRVTRVTMSRINLPGAAIARTGWLARLASPFLGVVKFFRTALVFTLQFPGEGLRRPALLVFLALGAFWWARGFAAGARTGLSGVRGWTDPEEPIFTLLKPLGEGSDSK